MTMKRIFIIAVLAMVLGIGISQSVKAFGNKAAVSLDGYNIGDRVTDFEMKNVDGEMYSLGAIEGANGYIVIFTSNTCPFAVANEDRMIELHKEMAPRGYPVVAINANQADGDSFDDMVVRADEKDFPFLYLRDEKDAIYKKFGANKTPHVFVLDSDLTVQYIGAIDDNAQDGDNVSQHFVADAIAALEKGETPNPATTKAVGCPIKTNGGDHAKGGGRRGPPNPETILEHMDANNDGEITKAEAKGPLVRDFDRVDADGDGKLTMAELKNMKGPGGPK